MPGDDSPELDLPETEQPGDEISGPTEAEQADIDQMEKLEDELSPDVDPLADVDESLLEPGRDDTEYTAVPDGKGGFRLPKPLQTTALNDEPAEDIEKPSDEPDKTEEVEDQDKTGAKPAWDAERQRRDQERAALRKENDVLKAKLDALGKGEGEPEGEPEKSSDGQRKAYETTQPQYVEDDDVLDAVIAAEVAEEQGALPPLPDAVPEPPEDPWDDEANAAYRKERADYDKALLAREKAREQRDLIVQERSAAERNKRAAAKLFDEALTEAFGKDQAESHRNTLTEKVLAECKADGYDEGRFPTPQHARRIIREQALALKLELIEKGELGRKPKEPTTQGRTRPAAAASVPKGMKTLEQAKADLMKQL